MSRFSDLAGLECIKATYITHVFPRHIHEGFAIGLIEAGVQATDYRGAKHYATAGDICLINPGEPHTGYAPDEGGWTYRCSYPSAAALREAAEDTAGRPAEVPYFPSPVIRDTYVACLLRDFFASLDDCGNRLEKETRFLTALIGMIGRHATARPNGFRTGRERPAVQKVRGLIHDRYRENISLADLAAVSGMSRYHLIRVFRMETGLSPHAYLTQVRVDKAKELLARRVPLAHAAQAAGFFDQSHLTRHFKSITGLTPGQYSSFAQ